MGLGIRLIRQVFSWEVSLVWGRYLREKPQWLPKPQRGLILGFLFKKNSQHLSLLLLLLVSSAGCASIKTDSPTEYVATSSEEKPELTRQMLDELARTEAEIPSPGASKTEIAEIKAELEAKTSVEEVTRIKETVTGERKLLAFGIVFVFVVLFALFGFLVPLRFFVFLVNWFRQKREPALSELLTGKEISDESEISDDMIRARYKAIREGYAPRQEGSDRYSLEGYVPPSSQETPDIRFSTGAASQSGFPTEYPKRDSSPPDDPPPPIGELGKRKLNV